MAGRKIPTGPNTSAFLHNKYVNRRGPSSQVCANLPDFVWFTLSVIGIEPTTPLSFLDVSIQALHADSFYSHGGFWVLAMAVVSQLSMRQIFGL